MDRYLIQRHLFDDGYTVAAIPCGDVVAVIHPIEEGYRATVAQSIVPALAGETLEQLAERVWALRTLSHGFCKEGNAATVSQAIDTLPLFS